VLVSFEPKTVSRPFNTHRFENFGTHHMSKHGEFLRGGGSVLARDATGHARVDGTLASGGRGRVASAGYVELKV